MLVRTPRLDARTRTPGAIFTEKPIILLPYAEVGVETMHEGRPDHHRRSGASDGRDRWETAPGRALPRTGGCGSECAARLVIRTSTAVWDASRAERGRTVFDPAVAAI